VWYQSGLWQSIKVFEMIENVAKRDERKALDEFLISVILGRSPHRPPDKPKQTCSSVGASSI
jgi:hypothetical protein